MIGAVIKPKPIQRLAMWDAINKGNPKKYPGRPTRAQFFKWLRELEKAQYFKGWNDGETFGIKIGYHDGRRDGESSTRSNY